MHSLKHRIAVLASHGVPTVGHYYRSLLNVAFCVDIITNGKFEKKRDVDVWEERTGGRLAPIEWNPTLQFEFISSSECAAALSEYDIAVNGGCLELIGDPALRAPRFGVLNVHPGILPQYRGASSVEWALYNGDVVGATAHIMDSGYDTGPIVAQRTIDPIKFGSYKEIRIAVYELCFALAAEAVTGLLLGSLTPTPQGHGSLRGPISEIQMKVVRERYG